MLAAFRVCKAAVYRLSVFGVDTISASTFRVVKDDGTCALVVATSVRVVPQPPRPAVVGHCGAIVRRGSDIVAARCRGGGLAAAVSLTGP